MRDVLADHLVICLSLIHRLVFILYSHAVVGIDHGRHEAEWGRLTLHSLLIGREGHHGRRCHSHYLLIEVATVKLHWRGSAIVGLRDVLHVLRVVLINPRARTVLVIVPSAGSVAHLKLARQQCTIHMTGSVHNFITLRDQVADLAEVLAAAGARAPRQLVLLLEHVVADLVILLDRGLRHMNRLRRARGHSILILLIEVTIFHASQLHTSSVSLGSLAHIVFDLREAGTERLLLMQLWCWCIQFGRRL